MFQNSLPLSLSAIQNSEVNLWKSQKWLEDVNNVVAVESRTLQHGNSKQDVNGVIYILPGEGRSRKQREWRLICKNKCFVFSCLSLEASLWSVLTCFVWIPAPASPSRPPRRSLSPRLPGQFCCRQELLEPPVNMGLLVVWGSHG